MMGAVLDPAGLIASKELSVLTDAFWLMLITAIAVFALTIFFAYWYRASNKKAVYLPDWQHGALSELVWWAIPFEIVLVLGALLVNSTHALDPREPIASSEPALTVQTVALPGKWLFIYPDYGIATAGVLYLPVDRPVAFSITADAPMNSLWIPALGGQIYAMTGMETKLNLMAEREGDYRGGSANYSGEGFAQMAFMTHVLSATDFARWAASAKKEPPLTEARYEALRALDATVPRTYGAVADNLFESIIITYMSPESPWHTH